MKRTKISKILAALFIGTAITTGCTDTVYDDSGAAEFPRGFITLDLSFSQGTRVSTTVNGEYVNNENAINSIDIFFYKSEDDENTAATYVKHDSSPTSSIAISIKDMTAAFGDGVTSCKVIAVANCSATKSLTSPTISDLKKIELTAKNTSEGLRDFRSAKAPTDFVMTNFAQMTNGVTPNTVTWTENSGSGTIELKRVAAKIRVALNVEPTIIDDDNKTWTADTDDMRLFISNGVTKGQLDGSHITLADTDYYSIQTSGSKGNEETETGDYFLAREINNPGKPASGAPENPEGETYSYYNEIPYYTYPNKWEESMLETTQTTLTIVVPWYHGEGSGRIYRPTYYTIPVNNGTTIESNKYYYLRMHIGIMGSVTPEKPMEVDMQCEIADWGDADKTVADIRPIRYLIFNQTEFEMHNTTKIEIPFASTHDCKVESFEGQFSDFYIDSNGVEIVMTFNDDTDYATFNGRATNNGKVKGEGKFYNYRIEDNVLIFEHNFFDVWGVDSRSNGTTSEGLKKYKVSTMTLNISDPKTESKTYHRLFSKFVVKIKVRHNSGNSNIDQNYEETITLTIYPAIYIESEDIPAGSSRSSWKSTGWMYVNGYDSSNTGGLGRAGTTPGSSDMRALTTITVTQLNEDEAAIWSIDDPRSNYINNDLSGSNHLTDLADNTTQWSELFDGSQSNRNSVEIDRTTYSGVRTMWQYFDNVDPVTWGNGQVWKAANDKTARKMMYYYPTAESQDKIDIIAPKIVFTSYHMYATPAVDRGTARRRCATLQIYGYPAGRWRLPTLSEIRLVKTLMSNNVVRDIFYNESNTNISGNGTAWSNIGPTGNGITQGDINGTSYVRCVYDLWYWEKKDGARIPSESDYYYFTWGDRPKENPQTRAAGGNTVGSFLQENAPGNYAITREGNKVKREKMN